MIAFWLQVDLYHKSRDKAPDPAELGAISLLHKYHYAQLQTQTSAEFLMLKGGSVLVLHLQSASTTKA